MNDAVTQNSASDLGEYCRKVEDHLTRVNGGHLVRIVGAGFELVRAWAASGVPLSVVFRGIDNKAERHREGKARRPLRIEFCEADVRAVFDNWRRAVGLQGREDSQGSEEATDAAAAPPNRIGPVITRAIDRLSRVGGRMDLPEELRDVCDRVLQELVDIKSRTAKARGEAREKALSRLPGLDADLAEAVRAFIPDETRRPVIAQAEADLAPYRGRLAADAWQKSVDITTDRLLRSALGLPLLDL